MSRPAASEAPLRIAHVYKDYPPVMGGVEHYIQQLAEGHAADGHQLQVLVTQPGLHTGRETAAGGGIEILRAGQLGRLASTPLSPEQVLRQLVLRADILHLHSPYPPAELVWLLGRQRPMVLTYHSDVVRQKLLGALLAPVLRATLRRADRILATSPAYAASSPFLSAVPERTQVVPVAVDVARFADQDREAARARYACDGPTLVFVGRLVYYKGLDVLIEALPALPGVTLLAVGTGPKATAWRALAEDLGVADRIRWLGDVTDADLPGVYAAGDLFVLPAVARSEAFGIVLLEAMASGLPCVSTELGTGTSWANQDGLTGRVVPASDPAALSDAIRSLLGEPQRLREMADAARRRATDEFDVAKLRQRVMQVYRDVLAERTA